MTAREPEMIVALDVPRADAIAAMVEALPAAARWYKVGLELFCSDGPAALRPLQDRGRRIFLDLKLHDIPRTVERAVRAAAAHGVHMLTAHASGGFAMLQAAAAAAREFGAQRPQVVAVTALTSLAAEDLADVGVARSMPDHVAALADLALRAGMDGLVCSPREVAGLRERFGLDPLLVTPGIRARDADAGDQKRTATAAEAVRAGASHLVVGRPILDAPDPRAAAARILAEIREATGSAR